MLHKLIAALLRAWHYRLAARMDRHLQKATQAAENAAQIAVNHEQATGHAVAALNEALVRTVSDNEKVQDTAKAMAEKAQAFKHLL